MDCETWIFGLAPTLGAGKAAWLPVGKRCRDVRWPGLTLESLRKALDCCGIADLTDDELVTLINRIESWQPRNGVRLISTKHLGERLNLTVAEYCGSEVDAWIHRLTRDGELPPDLIESIWHWGEDIRAELPSSRRRP